LDGEHLRIEVDDDGTGTAAVHPTDGHGLSGMRERCALLGGDLTAGPTDHGGFRIQARLPVQPARQP
jgi:signal transduction histidine kinase